MGKTCSLDFPVKRRIPWWKYPNQSDLSVAGHLAVKHFWSSTPTLNTGQGLCRSSESNESFKRAESIFTCFHRYSVLESEKEMATHSSILAWRILWTEEPGGLPSMGLHSRTWLKWLSMHACIGEGNGNPLQCSYLENPRDRGAWWAAIHGVAQSRTQLKCLSSSSKGSVGIDLKRDLLWSPRGKVSQSEALEVMLFIPCLRAI